MLIKYAQWLVAQYYQTLGNTKLVILAAWMPGMPKSSDEEAKILSWDGFDLIRPDYYGYARSDGFFSTKNCMQTVYDTIQTFRQKIPMFDLYGGQELLPQKYDEIVIVGTSYGGRVAAMTPKIDPSIEEVVLLYPYLGDDNMDRRWYPEESDEEFLRQYSLIYRHLYRLAPDSDPYDAFMNFGSYMVDDLSHLQDTKVFVAHGTADEVIWYGRSKEFVEQLLAMNLQGQYKYAEYYGLDHGYSCKQAGLLGWLHRRSRSS